MRRRNQTLEDDICAERAEKQKLQETVSQLSTELSIECKVCYGQDEKWAALACRHMFCGSCVENFDKPQKCSLCRALITGYIICYPFAGWMTGQSLVEGMWVFFQVQVINCLVTSQLNLNPASTFGSCVQARMTACFSLVFPSSLGQ